MRDSPHAAARRRAMRGHLIAKGLAWLGGGAFILLLLSASGVLNLLTAGTRSNHSDSAPLADPAWQAMHAEYVADLRIQDAAEGLQLVLYGDDLIESWRGTAGGKPCPACEGISDVWQRHFGSLWRARAYGIAGTGTSHLLWRLRNGGTPQRQPPVQVLYVGATDLDSAYSSAGTVGAASAAPAIVARVEESLKLLHGRRPTGRVLLLGLLPRVPTPQQAGGVRDSTYNAAGTPEGFPWPSPLAAGIAAVNERLEALADRYPAAHFVDCGSALTMNGAAAGARLLSRELVPDGRQPAPEGMHRIGLCLDSLVHHLITGPPPIGASFTDEDDDPTPERPENLQTRYVEETKKPKKAKDKRKADAAQASSTSGNGTDATAAVTAAAADTVVQPQVATATA